MKLILCIFLFLSILTTIIYSQYHYDILISKTGAYPAIDVDSDNNLHIVWSESMSPLKYATLDLNGNFLTDEKNISESNSPISPSLILKDTFVLSVWNQREATHNSYIDGQLFINTDSFAVNNLRYNDPYYDAIRSEPNIEWLNDTLYIVVWSGDGYLTPINGTGIYGKLVSTSNIFLSTDLLLTDHGSENVQHDLPKIVNTLDSNKFFVAWRDNFLGNYRIFGRFFHYDGEPFDESFLISDDVSSSGVWDLDIDIDKQGNIVIVWGNGDLSYGEIKWQWIDATGNFISDIEKISTEDYVVSSSVAVSVAIDSNDDIIVVWEDKRSGKSEIYGQRFKPDKTKLGKVFKISSRTTNYSQVIPEVILKNNKIFTAWYEVGNYFEGVWANIIDFYDPLLDYREVVQTVSLSKSYAAPGKDSLLIEVKTNEVEGFVLFAEIESPDENPVDTIFLYDDGFHSDRIAGDSIYTNYWIPPTAVEQNYFVDVHIALNEIDTVSFQRDNMGIFTSIGPIIYDGIIYTTDDSIANPGDNVQFKLALINNGLNSMAKDISAEISTNDTCISGIYKSKVSYGDLIPGERVVPDLDFQRFAVKIDPDCNVDKDILFDISITSEGRFFWSDSFAIRVIPLSVDDEKKNILPNEFKLHQNYPNPFNPNTTIKYSISDVETTRRVVFTKLTIYDVLGREVTALVNKDQLPGNYQVKFDASQLPSGIYYYQLIAGNFTAVKKMVLLR